MVKPRYPSLTYPGTKVPRVVGSTAGGPRGEAAAVPSSVLLGWVEAGHRPASAQDPARPSPAPTQPTLRRFWGKKPLCRRQVRGRRRELGEHREGCEGCVSSREGHVKGPQSVASRGRPGDFRLLFLFVCFSFNALFEVAGFDGIIWVWAKKSRLDTIVSSDGEVIPKKMKPLS